MALPDFIGIGAQRTGTTRLYELLKQHPEICMAMYRKEVHYFDRYYHKGERWYRSLFDHCKGKNAGEITPAYIYDEKCAERIHKLLPDVKLIAILRNPINRAYSQFKLTIRQKGYQGSFSEFLQDYRDAVERGLYYKQIMRYLEFFPRDKLKILLFEDMVVNPYEEMSKIFWFLGVDTSFIPIDLEKKVGASQIPRFHGLYVRGKKITSKLHDLDMNWVIEGLKRVGIKRFFSSREQRWVNLSKPTEFEYNRLKQFYEKDTMELSFLLNRDLKKLWGFED